MPTVALDVMSGDAGVAAAVGAARLARRRNPQSRIVLVGDADEIARVLRAEEEDAFEVRHAEDVVRMTDAPARAIRKRRSSMRRALEMVAAGEADAAVSAGNTGALMGLGVVVLGVIEGIARPAIASFIPNRREDNACCMLDLGANVKCTPAMLHDFAVMGAALTRAVRGKANPRIGLLNIGEESHKGGEALREAATLLEENPNLNFVGNVEGYAIYSQEADGVDVVVCDGFSGNVALKVSEGLARMMRGMLSDAVRASWLSRVCALLAMPLLRRVRRDFDPRRYNGACLLGLRGVVVKSHGNADRVALAAAIQVALDAAGEELPARIAEHAGNIGGGGEAAAGEAAETAMDGLSAQAV